MSKVLKIAGGLVIIGIVAVVALFATGTLTASAADGAVGIVHPGPGNGPGGPNGGGQLDPNAPPRDWIEPYKDQIHAALADALGMTVDELTAARDAGQLIDQIIADKGIDPTTVQDAMKAAHEAVINQALADGALTQDQADFLLERLADGDGFGPGFGPDGHRGPGGMGPLDPNAPPMGWMEPYRDQIDSALADALGMTTDELQAAKDAGQRINQIITDKGIDSDTVQEAMKAAYEAVINQALADSVLTQAQADFLLQRLAEGNGFGPGFGPGGHHGMGVPGMGGRGGFGHQPPADQSNG